MSASKANSHHPNEKITHRPSPVTHSTFTSDSAVGCFQSSWSSSSVEPLAWSASASNVSSELLSISYCSSNRCISAAFSALTSSTACSTFRLSLATIGRPMPAQTRKSNTQKPQPSFPSYQITPPPDKLFLAGDLLPLRCQQTYAQGLCFQYVWC